MIDGAPVIHGLNSECCDRILCEKVNQLEIPQSEKNMLKKLIPLSHIDYGLRIKDCEFVVPGLPPGYYMFEPSKI